MKRLLSCCVMLVLLSVSSQSQVRFGVQGDLTNLDAGGQNTGGSISDLYGIGYGGGVHFDVSTPIISFRLSGDYIRFNPDQEKGRALLAKFIGSAAAGITFEGGVIDVYSANLNLNLSILPLPIIHVYVTGGGGFVWIRSAETIVKNNGNFAARFQALDPQNKPSLNAGAGVEIKLGPISLFGEVKVNWLLTEGQTSVMIPLGTVGITF